MISGKPKAILHAVDGISFSIRRGETLALVGESGCGKSTTARMLVGLYKPTFGKIEIAGYDLANLHGKEGKLIRNKMQMIFQDPYASLNPRWTVGRIVAEPIYAQKLFDNKKDIEDRVNSVLRLVNLSVSDKSKYPHQFSGVSANGYPSQEQLPFTRSFWFVMNRLPRWMFPFRLRY